MLDKEKVRKIARDYSLEVAKILNPDKIILFGSYVNGTPHSESDIDIAVFVRGLDDAAWYDARISLQNILWNRAFLSIEPHLLEEAHDRSGFAAHILNTGEVIYESPVSVA
jgi:predicted nucleotidyltransferase